MGICGSVIIADWQSVGGDPCDQYSYDRFKAASSNLTFSDSCVGGDDGTPSGVLQYVAVVEHATIGMHALLTACAFGTQCIL